MTLYRITMTATVTVDIAAESEDLAIEEAATQANAEAEWTVAEIEDHGPAKANRED